MIILIIQIVLAVLLIVSVLLQPQGSGVGSMFGAAGGEHYHTRRGLEGVLFKFTFIGIALFVVTTIASVLLIQ